MYRRNTELRVIDRVNFALTNGALGDMITSLAAIIWARQDHHPDLKMVLWVHGPQIELVRHLLAPYGEFEDVRPISDLDRALNEKDQRFAGSFALNCVQPHVITRNRMDMVDFAHATLLDRLPRDDFERSYPTAAPLGPRPERAPARYAVVPVGGTSENKMFRGPVLEGVLRGLLARGLRPVITGKSSTEVKVSDLSGKWIDLQVKNEFDAVAPEVRAQCLDLRDRLTLLELRDWCGYANVVLGMDGGTLHLAGTTPAPIVYGCTQVAPEHRPIVREGRRNWRVKHITPRNLECTGCQSNWTLMFKHDFRQCLYKDFACTHQMHADDFLAAVDEIAV